MDIETFITASGAGITCDWRVAAGSLAVDHDIKTAVLLSLFTDRRAEADDALPDASGSRRGWWGDAFSRRRIGSRLWLLSREKQTAEVVNRAREYAREALAWLVEDGVASAIEVSAAILAPGQLGLHISVSRNPSPPASFRFQFAWAGVGQVTQ